MPTYLYLCEKNIEDGGHGEFEEYHSIRDDAKLIECPHCRKEKDLCIPVKRMLSGGSGRGIVELTGQDFIAKTKSDAQQFKKDVHKSENLYSNVLGNDKYQSLQQHIDKQRR